MCNTLFVPLISLLFVFTTAALESPIPGYGVFEPRWQVKAFPDGELVPLSGTIEQVVHELRRINPSFDEHFGSNESADGDAVEKRREKVWFEKVICDNFRKTDNNEVRNAIAHLERVEGKPENDGGKERCGRVSCGYDVSVWWCNDAAGAKTPDSFQDIADGIWTLAAMCNKHRSGWSGQAFHEMNWNVVVKWEMC
ncbi:hypothetical protein Cob_v007067 [Colletotrichum orbiculare MAFF 240422]|uniref:Secreted protein n=1 Tax=Colletotrichum orbiculare (strain 104-T / ATCC 96160 / CBS 514.97 / LARS 414 / MAFF 240422) TaxID=1213857 RepID=N4UXZ9_COLOR|nr:hypothetical protein Cob_v007067 [Colletotrichum orbiculare MAFF 240422]